MVEAKLIERDGEQWVLLPAEFHLPAKRVRVVRSGDSLVLTPVKGRFAGAADWVRARFRR